MQEHIGNIIPECVIGALYVCPSPQDIATYGDTPSFSDVSSVAHEVVVSLDVDRPQLRIGPEPNNNEWQMAVAGYPLWLWTDEPATKAFTVWSSGYEFKLTARRTMVLFSAGDRTAEITCTTTRAYPGESALGEPSPSCGHTYTKPSTGGRYTLRATAVWEVDWSAMGYSGMVPLRLTATRDLKVGELQSVIRP